MRTFLVAVLLLAASAANAQSSFDKKIDKKVRELNCPEPGGEAPVTLNAAVVAEEDSLAIIVKVALAAGWHIYEYVPPTLPYIPIEQILQLPAGVDLVGKWKKSAPSTYANDPGVLIYEGQAVFVHKALKTGTDSNGKPIRAGLYYQTCDLRQCLPPVEKIFELAIPVN